MSLAAGNLYRGLVTAVYPAAASYYRSLGTHSCPVPLLKLLGIADPSYRSDFYTLHHIVGQMAGKGGLFAECGVYRGATLLGMAHRLRELGENDYELVGFDSFEGFPEPVREDALPNGNYHPRTIKGVFSDTSFEHLQNKVTALGFAPKITLVKGFFENTLPAWRDKRFSVVHLDCDLYESYRTCLEFFYPRVEKGGFIVFDEYDFSESVYPGARKAIDQFFAERPEQVQRFPESPNPRYFIIKV